MPDNFNTKRIKDWGKVATRLMLAFGNFIPLDGPDGTFKVPAEFFSFIENFKISQAPGYVYAITDASDVFLFGIKSDGSVDWAKGIPEHLQNILNDIAASLETKVDKVAGESLINAVFASGVSVVTNEEYLLAVTDASGSVLFGVEKDGTFAWSKGVPGYIKAPLEKLLYEITTKVDKVAGESLVNAVFADGISIGEDKEFVLAFTDSDGRFLFGVRKDGSVDWAKGIPQSVQNSLNALRQMLDGKQDAIPGKTVVDSKFSDHVDSNNEDQEWFKVVCDSVGKIIEGIRVTGEHVFMLPVQLNGGVNWTKDNLDDLSRALKENGFTGGTGDWSDKASLEIPVPKMAIINFTNIAQMPQAKDTNAHAVMEFWDMDGNYFKKNVIANAQGSSSMKWSKKNVGIDICNDEWVGDDTFKIKFGEWVPQDSFHLKAYATDYFKCVGLAGYDLVKDVMNTRTLNTTWKQSINYGTNPVGTENVSTRLDSGALCFPQGFICKVFLNGNFEGLFCWQLKKHRDNYNMDKKASTNIHIEGMLGASYFWNGTIDWTQFEVRNPKDLITYAGADYDGDNPTELIDSTSPAYNSNNSKHVKTAQVKQYIVNLSQRMLEVNAAANPKELFEQYFGLDSCIDYAVVSDAVYNYDYMKNIQWTTWDGEKWFLNFYDLDCTLGANSSADSIHYPTTTHTTTATMHPLRFVVENYTAELEARWAELRRLGIVDAENIAHKIERYMRTWGKDAYKAESERWPGYPYDRDMVVDNENWELEVDSEGNPVIYTATYHTWNDSTNYVVGDVVQYNPSTSSQASQGWWYRFTALAANTNKKPVTTTGFKDNIFRLYNWLKQQIENMDTLYNYTQGG